LVSFRVQVCVVVGIEEWHIQYLSYFLFVEYGCIHASIGLAQISIGCQPREKT